jgi:hypothetical protein
MRLLRVLLILLLFPALLAGVAGWFAAPAFLHPIRHALTPDLIQFPVDDDTPAQSEPWGST